MASEKTRARRVADRYTLQDHLGKGGMGVVWRAMDDTLKRPVAIKEVMLPASVPLEERDALRARVLREARAAARLTHPRAVTIFDAFEEDGRNFIVMELVDAPTLADLIKQQGPLDPKEAAQVGVDVLDALEAAHREGIVHRDVKPGNVMVTDTGGSKLADFGIASLKGDPKITTTGMIMGSPSFMAPEQATGEESGPEADLYALGATLYYAVEGRPPFDKGQPIPTLTAVVHDDVDPPRSAGALGAVICTLLAKQPQDRPGPDELRSDLQAVIDGPAFEPQAREVVPASPVPAPEAPARGPARPAAKSRKPLVAAIVLMVAALAALAFLALNDDDQPPADRAGSQRNQQGGNNDPEPVTLPEGFVRFEIPGTDYSVAHPEGWESVASEGGNYDIRDQVTGTYLRVASTDAPGDDAAQAWFDQEEGFSASHDDYQRITIEDVDFHDFDEAALWEFTWSEGGADLHAYDLGFVTNDGERGFALNLVAREENFDDLQETWEQIMASFEPGE